ncbi:calcineurin-like phosphoesterase C-terminal domain-containing protein [Sphingobacterium paludis]|uniref:3',5'-cyclic AMP phosphodiesterase CpdA n=1 Tax=Sphingobacterium paludis TaxID=1476465 RepID=A0A4R7D1B6_9SPHI|nr:calcineurin-like phosphoesterase family protein [Sphingobacterium paludis]TDS13841.1 3',5'-cyclic AMP phosphodiesterase CpdA [Sphingobacterium paludis]
MLLKETIHLFQQRSACYLFLSLLFFIFSACGKELSSAGELPPPTAESNKLDLGDVRIPLVWDVVKESTTQILGRGFQINDEITFAPLDGLTKSFSMRISEAQETQALLKLPADFVEGRYTITASRGNAQQTLGTSSFNFVLRADIPDMDGKTVKGIIHVAGKGLGNVVVSDGYDVTRTNEEGVYYLSSNKRTGYVFVSIPGNYEMVSTNQNLPLFYRYLNANPAVIDTRDFELKPVNNENHVMLGLADMHLANRNDDLAQFQNGFIADANQQIANVQSEGKKVYALTLGDLTWETYWYSNSFMLPEYVKEIATLNAPVFNTIGNHDNDPYFASDWLSENAYRRILGPTYYSFNIGQVHYIVLDNIEYINSGGANGSIGSRNYNAKLVEQQIDWLKKDLATVDPATPIILATHIQLHNAPASNGSLPGFRMSNGQQLVDLFAGFSQVHVLTGHTHINNNVVRDNSFMEHNTAAICATWWWTGRNGYANNHIAPDGSPGGYAVWDATGKVLKWRYKAIGYEDNYQFRSYDLNTVHITSAKYAPDVNVENQRLVTQYAFDFAQENKANEVLINVWGYDPKWTIAVTEQGVSLPVQRVSSYDPLHIISYAMKRINVNAVPTFDSSNTSHMFKVKASSASSTLQIRVTDRFGNSYTEQMERPKAFHYAMR